MVAKRFPFVPNLLQRLRPSVLGFGPWELIRNIKNGIEMERPTSIDRLLFCSPAIRMTITLSLLFCDTIKFSFVF